MHPHTPASRPIRPRARRRGLGWLARSAFLLFALVLVLGAPRFAVAADRERGVVGVRFEIDAKRVLMNLSAARAGVEAAATAQLTERCRDRFPYVEWRPLTNAPASNDPPFLLRVSMTAVGGAPVPEVVLRAEKRVSGSVQRLGLERVLYLANDMGQPYQNATRLAEDLARHLGDWYANEQVLDLVQERFLAGIPVARRLRADPVNQRFVLPAFWHEMLPGEGSIVRAQYQVRRSPADLVPVRLRLRPSEEWSGEVGCRVREFHFPPIDLDTPGWMPVMVESLSNAVPGSVVVFMEKYMKDHTYGSTTNGLVLDPFDASGVGGTL
ncbi:MAG: hypothetical protein IT580_05965 [Verrucomicrobiales bacterium]|nr:hypothetical protein [Verrucomicrobiales bacterium]